MTDTWTDKHKEAEPMAIQPLINLATRVHTAEAIAEFDQELLHHLHWLKRTLFNADIVQAKAIAARLATYISEAS